MRPSPVISLLMIGLGAARAGELPAREPLEVAGVAASSKAPDVLLIMAHDVVFAASFTFGGPSHGEQT